MRRVVVTGMGIVSSIGNSTQEVLASLREAKSGISAAADYKRLGFRCQVHGAPTLDPAGMVDRRAMRFHGGGTAWNHVAMDEAIREAIIFQSPSVVAMAIYLPEGAKFYSLIYHLMQRAS